MELEILDKDRKYIGTIDEFDSLLWVERYCGFGDFKLTSSPKQSNLNLAINGIYAILDGSEQVMVIDSFSVLTDIESGNKLVIEGRSLESYLNRRIVWNPTILSGSFQNGIKNLLEENVLIPEDISRKISLFNFFESTDPAILASTIESQYFGENLYDVITNLCLKKDFGYVVKLTEDFKFEFRLYAGADRSYDQTENPFVVFSSDFENLVNSNYLLSDRYLKTTTLVAGEKGVGNVRETIEINLDDGLVELDRREIFTDAASVTRNVQGSVLTDEEYALQLENKGLENLIQNTVLNNFEGQGTDIFSKYGIEFFMGDVVQVQNEYGHEAKSRIVEIVRVQDSNGILAYPTFKSQG